MRKFLKYFIITFTLTIVLLISFNVKLINADLVYPFNGIISSGTLAVHSTDDFKDSSTVTELVYGTRVVVTGSSTTGNRYIIKYNGNQVGYVSKNFVVNIDNSRTVTDSTIPGIENYRSYCDKLIASGFVESYCPYLYNMHIKHPTWVFKADVVNSTLDVVAKGELGTNVLQTGNPNFWKADGYGPIEGDYYYVNESVIAAFMDPRNSLYEERVMQFLDYEVTKDIANDNALSDIVDGGYLSRYYNEFKKAASEQGINALHLMSRSLNEGANKGKFDAASQSWFEVYNAVSGLYSTTTGKIATNGRTLDGFYNFFNIGAWQTKDYSPVARGLAYAAGFLEMGQNGQYKECYTFDAVTNSFVYDTNLCGTLIYLRPWNTPEAAIAGGAQFLAQTYVKMGQSTNYYEKFNVSPYSKHELFAHQYMTNIAAPVSESKVIVDALRAGGLMDANLVFNIPVYLNMPDVPYVPVDKSSNSKLLMVKVDGKDVPGFDGDVIEIPIYNYLTNNNYIDVSVLAEDSNATVTGIGKLTFVNNVVNANIVVKAENGNQTVYKLVVKKISPQEVIKVDDIVGKMGVKVNGNIMYEISPGTIVTTLLNTVTNNKGYATVYDKGGLKKTGGSLVTGDKIEIMGTNEKKTYIISIRGDVNGDGSVTVLDLLRTQKHILKSITLSGEQFYAADTNYDGIINVVDLLKIQKHILGNTAL